MKSVLERFESRFSIDPETGCWMWQGSKAGRGYGQMRIGNRKELAHRIAYMLLTGDHPGDGVVCHRCDTPSCVNPDHLFVGTQTENAIDCLRKERQGKAKITADHVREIRRRAQQGETAAQIAADMPIHRISVHQIITGQSWTWVGDAA